MGGAKIYRVSTKCYYFPQILSYLFTTKQYLWARYYYFPAAKTKIWGSYMTCSNSHYYNDYENPTEMGLYGKNWQW